MNTRTELRRENGDLRRNVAISEQLLNRAEELLTDRVSIIDAKNAQLIYLGAPIATITDTIEATLLHTATARANPRVREIFQRRFGRELN